MCGRTCLTLSPEEIQNSCKYKLSKCTSNERKVTPEWRDEYNCGKKYEQSYNIAPSDCTPVLISASHFDDDDGSKRNIVPMVWGMIPFWHKGDFRKHGLSTNNCRLENIMQSKLYKPSLKRGQRCVILWEGFYEWQTTNSTKKSSERSVYYIYMPQKESIKIENNNTFKCGEDLNLLKMAGLFDIWTNDNGNKVYSYSIITFESDTKLGWLHHRTPAILETEQQVADWLDFDRVGVNAALELLQPPSTILWYQVSNIVNKSQNKSDKCNKPINEVDLKNERRCTPKSKIMQSWLIRKDKNNEMDKKCEDENLEQPEKKIKLQI